MIQYINGFPVDVDDETGFVSTTTAVNVTTPEGIAINPNPPRTWSFTNNDKFNKLSSNQRAEFIYNEVITKCKYCIHKEDRAKCYDSRCIEGIQAYLDQEVPDEEIS